MEKNIKNNQSITNEYISKIVKNTDRLVKQLKFLSDVNIPFTQVGGSSVKTSSLTGSETIEPDTGNQESNDIKKALVKATYDTLLTNIENIIKYFQENNKDYTSRINSNVNILIDNYRHVHPFENYPNVIPFEKITSLSNIITSLKIELQNEKFKKFIDKLEVKKNQETQIF